MKENIGKSNGNKRPQRGLAVRVFIAGMGIFALSASLFAGGTLLRGKGHPTYSEMENMTAATSAEVGPPWVSAK